MNGEFYRLSLAIRLWFFVFFLLFCSIDSSISS